MAWLAPIYLTILLGEPLLGHKTLCDISAYSTGSLVPMIICLILSFNRFISSPLQAIAAITNSEFHSPPYQTLSAGPGSPTLGQQYMALFNFPYSKMTQWGAIIFLAGLSLIFTLILAPLALRRIRYDGECSTFAFSFLKRWPLSQCPY